MPKPAAQARTTKPSTSAGSWVGAQNLGSVSTNAGSVADNVGRKMAPVSANLG
jgi:hypothetical protein